MLRRNTIIDYKGYELVKKGKSSYNIKLNGQVVGYSNTLANSKKAVDRRINKGL